MVNKIYKGNTKKANLPIIIKIAKAIIATIILIPSIDFFEVFSFQVKLCFSFS